ncbi:acyl-CoA desaturase [Corallococcus sp. H22C18031201]|nr:acyl-CoA desaturase [Citreicoccus inhibens]RJS15763.1 acyl-CoA desaturase [Corallococcus sp. H22C18031201]
MTTPARVTFAHGDATHFGEEVKRRVAEYFESRNLSQKANTAMVVKSFLLLGLTFGTYGLLLTNAFGPWAMLGMAVVMGVGIAGLGFSVAHDGLHGAYSDNPRVNLAAGLVFDLLGANGYMWKLTHNVIHHTYTNLIGVDEDLTVSPQLRLSPHAEWKPYHRVQHLYAFFAYGLSTIFWVFVKDYKYFLAKDLGPYKGKKHPASEWAILFAMKAVYYTWSLVVPVLVLHVTWWQFLIGLLTMHLTAGGILGIVFQLAHVVEETQHPLPDASGKVENTWMVHQLQTTSNFARKNKLLSWYVGGLNFQIEHHLFPKVCSVHYPAISEIVRETALKHGLTYPEAETFMDAVGSHYRTLRELGKRPSPAPERVNIAMAA